ncbi:MAG TPA: FAD-dependent oxidoreductase [Casimicrobiaceae bacterium]
MSAERPSSSDIAIIGGGIVGSSVAYFAKRIIPDASVCVVEPDPTYEFASTLRASGGCRVQFTCPENIDMSLFSLQFIREFSGRMSLPDRPADISWVEGGYLFVVPPEHMKALERHVRAQRARGCEVDLLSTQELKTKFPSINVEDLGGGAYTPRDGWCDPNSLLWGFRRKAQSLGATYIKDRLVDADMAPNHVRSLRLESGARLEPAHVVNAAGAWAGEVAKMMGMRLPISPLRRFEHYFTAGAPMERLPYVKDLARMAFRSEGAGFSGGVVDGSAERGFNFDVDHDYFERVVWPAVAHRFPPLEAAKCHRTWSGLYEQCELDGNPVIGRWTGRLENLYTVAGFSGHGMMHAPAAGRAIAELIAYGAYATIDLTRFGYERVERNAPYRETGIV